MIDFQEFFLSIIFNDKKMKLSFSKRLALSGGITSKCAKVEFDRGDKQVTTVVRIMNILFYMLTRSSHCSSRRTSGFKLGYSKVQLSG